MDLSWYEFFENECNMRWNLFDDFFYQTLCIRISRSLSGNELLACSLDGSIAYFSFTETELGKCLSENEKVTFNW